MSQPGQGGGLSPARGSHEEERRGPHHSPPQLRQEGLSQHTVFLPEVTVDKHVEVKVKSKGCLIMCTKYNRRLF